MKTRSSARGFLKIAPLEPSGLLITREIPNLGEWSCDRRVCLRLVLQRVELSSLPHPQFLSRSFVWNIVTLFLSNGLTLHQYHFYMASAHPHVEYNPPTTVGPPSPATSVGSRHPDDATSASDSESVLPQYLFERKWADKIGLGHPTPEEILGNREPLLTRPPEDSEQEKRAPSFHSIMAFSN